MFGSMKEKTVFITGGSKGIGKGIAKVFGGQGAKVFIVARSQSSVDTAVAELQKAGITAGGSPADIADKTSVETAVQNAVQTFGGIDVLCANAGIFPQAKLETMGENDWDDLMNTNLKGTFLTVQACIPYLKKCGAGRIIITSSITGPITGYPGWCHYAASKAAQLGFLRSAALELAPFGITVNAVLPGNIATEGLADQGEDYLKTMTASIPLHTLGEPEDIGYAALFFATSEARFITGQTLIVDGGQILPETLEAIL